MFQLKVYFRKRFILIVVSNYSGYYHYNFFYLFAYYLKDLAIILKLAGSVDPRFVEAESRRSISGLTNPAFQSRGIKRAAVAIPNYYGLLLHVKYVHFRILNITSKHIFKLLSKYLSCIPVYFHVTTQISSIIEMFPADRACCSKLLRTTMNRHVIFKVT